MDIRILGQQELLPALHLSWDVFVEDVAPSYTPEGVEEFRSFIKYDNMEPLCRSGELIFFGAYEEADLAGTLAVRRDGHICLFFVRKDYQDRGIGRMLCTACEEYCAQTLQVGKMTVNAAPGAVSKYASLGFQAAGEEQTVSGIRFVPMEREITASDKPASGKSRAPLIIGIVAGGLVLLLVLLFGVYSIGRGAFNYVREHYFGGYEEPYDGWHHDDDYGDHDNGYDDHDDHRDWDDHDYHDYDEHDRGEHSGSFGTGDYGAGGETDSGLEAIPAYEAEGLSYEIEEKDYTYSDKEKKSMLIDFQVKYPQINGLSGDLGKKVNDELKNCAMETVDKIYTNPSDSVKEDVLSNEYPALVSYVGYKISYINDEFISVVFQDYSYQGDSSTYHINLRTRNINLKDGTVYQVKDIVDMDEDFMDDWLYLMRDEADDDSMLSELSMAQMKQALEGDSLGGVYTANFFVHADGIEIGFDFNYKADDSHDLGYAWVTAPFDFSDIRAYKTKSAFWEAID